MDIVLTDIRKAYGENSVLEDFSHVFSEGRIHCVLGQSGCGKTTLLRIIAGLEKADSGAVSGVEGKKFSAVFQEDRLLENLTAERNILLTARPGFSRGDAKILLESLGLPAEKKPVSSFSGGMRRRVAIARALAADYDVLLLDEPLSGLDRESARQAMEIIQKSLNGRTCIWITHSPETAQMLGEEELHMKRE